MFCINAKSVRSLNIKLPNLVGFLFLVLAYIVIFHITKLYDLGRWARLCSVSGH
jgi:hypothetical protein